jgi:hypothetical protein
MLTKALVLAILTHLTPGADRAAEPAVVDAIVSVGDEATLREVALLTTYAWLESRAKVQPRPWSWDAKANVSCSYLQIPCAVARRLSLADQARYWLRELRAAGLASLDSSPKRAERRETYAMKALEAAESELR